MIDCEHKGIKLDLGCGRICPDGFIGIDLIQIIDGNGDKKVDIVMDIEKRGLPFCDNSVDIIKADNVLEHLDELIFVLNECHRVLKTDGIFTGIVPHADSDGAKRDPTHKRQFVKSSFAYFCGEGEAFPNQPSHPKYANYGILPWHMIELKGGEKGETMYFKLKPRKV